MFDFEAIEVISENGLVKVTLEHIGEGFSGDYDPEDPEDKPLLRYSLFRLDDGNENIDDVAEISGDDWWPVRDGSYCTLLNAKEDREELLKAAITILREVEDGLTNCHRERQVYEQLSYTNTR